MSTNPEDKELAEQQTVLSSELTTDHEVLTDIGWQRVKRVARQVEVPPGMIARADIAELADGRGVVLSDTVHFAARRAGNA